MKPSSDNVAFLSFGFVLLVLGAFIIFFIGPTLKANGFFIIMLIPGLIAIAVSRHEFFGDLKPNQYLLIIGLFILFDGFLNYLYLDPGSVSLLIPSTLIVVFSFLYKQKEPSKFLRDDVVNINMALSSLICALTVIGYLIRGIYNISYPISPLLGSVMALPFLVFVTRRLTKQNPWRILLVLMFFFLSFIFENIFFPVYG